MGAWPAAVVLAAATAALAGGCRAATPPPALPPAGEPLASPAPATRPPGFPDVGTAASPVTVRLPAAPDPAERAVLVAYLEHWRGRVLAFERVDPAEPGLRRGTIEPATGQYVRTLQVLRQAGVRSVRGPIALAPSVAQQDDRYALVRDCVDVREFVARDAAGRPVPRFAEASPVGAQIILVRLPGSGRWTVRQVNPADAGAGC